MKLIATINEVGILMWWLNYAEPDNGSFIYFMLDNASFTYFYAR